MKTTAVSVLRRANIVRSLCALALCALGTSAALAQDDLPGRVGRVADVGGELFLAPEERPDAWAAIGINYPITNGDNLWVGNDGRAEIDFGGGQFRLGGDTNLRVSRLDDRQFALFVAQGRVSVRVRAQDAGDTARVDTPNAQIVITRPGLYRIDVSDDRQRTRIVVREGEVNVQTGGGVQQVLPGQLADIDGPDARYATVENGIGTDGFDTWIASRDRYYDSARNNANYVSPQMVGAADLARYGSWSQMPEYGAVWYPNDVGDDWAPYRNGYWTDVGAWGPTWVDYAPWGYAPFHYGRWAHIGGRWGWVPGAYVARPRWAPAFVAWTGGSGWAVSVAGGSPVYGWVPLAWGEPYRPWWNRCSYGCWERYNRPYAVNVAVWRPNSAPPTRYRNWDAPGGMTAVTRTAFQSRQPVQQNLVRVPRDMIATAPVMSAPPPVRIEGNRTQRPVNAPPAAAAFQTPASRQYAAPVSPSAYNRGSPAPDSTYNRARSPTVAPSAPPATITRQAPSAAPYAPPPNANVQQPSMRQPQSQPTPSPQPQALPQQPSQPANVTRSRGQQPQAAQPQFQQSQAQPQLQPQQQPVMRAAPQPVPQPMPQRAAPQPMPQPHVAPQPQPQAAQPQAQPRAARDRGNDASPPDNPAGSGGGDGQRRGR